MSINLAPLTTTEELQITVFLLDAFSARKAAERRTNGANIGPASLGDALSEFRQANGSLGSRLFVPRTTSSLIQRLVREGLLTPAGSNGRSSPPLDACYWAMYALTAHQKRGLAWLTSVLGWQHLLHVASHQVCLIEGTTQSGDVRAGSGLILASGHVITNKHVVTDMNPHVVYVADREIGIEAFRSHPTQDVAIVYPTEPPGVPDAGISFREHRSVEPILVVGYPTVPTARSVGLTVQTGETCAAVVEDFSGCRNLLFSAIARPGNSGGPVFARDGRVIGLVARSLERPREVADAMTPLPFFAAVPARDVRDAIADIDPALPFPWETWDQ